LHGDGTDKGEIGTDGLRNESGVQSAIGIEAGDRTLKLAVDNSEEATDEYLSIRLKRDGINTRGV